MGPSGAPKAYVRNMLHTRNASGQNKGSDSWLPASRRQVLLKSTGNIWKEAQHTSPKNRVQLPGLISLECPKAVRALMILLPTANPALFAHSLALREVSLPSEHLVRVKDGVSKALYFVCDYSRVGQGTGKQKQDLRCNFDLTSLQPFTGTMLSPFFFPKYSCCFSRFPYLTISLFCPFSPNCSL